jgi:post-segregation antitoxin (ccd killing protein)
MSAVFDVSAVKRPTNLKIIGDLRAKAKTLNINVSATFEAALADVVQEREGQIWQEENKASIAAYENPNRDTRKAYPFLLDIQSNLIEDLTSTIVIPLVPKRAMGRPISRLNPTARIKRAEYVVFTVVLAIAYLFDHTYCSSIV